MKKEKQKTAKRSRKSLTIVLAIFVFLILLAAELLSMLAMFIFAKAGILIKDNGELQFETLFIIIPAISIVLGGTIAFFASRIPLKPFNDLINKMKRLAAGDYKARIEFSGPLSAIPAFNDISTSFNIMAQELEHTELLRSDFINNFSHEFKTPIVSIAGFAKLLNKGNLAEEQKAQYLHSIEEESMRLSYMATNVLNLTKVENQSILSEITTYNLSEQLRSAVLLLEGKWEKKDIELQLEFDEYRIDANEELLKQVWINLIDNAVKFAPQGGTIAVFIEDKGERLKITISNTGEDIPQEKLDKIFNKFYQADESHATEGNGIGLAIVKKVTDLHRGFVSVRSENGTTSFSVELPKKQKYGKKK